MNETVAKCCRCGAEVRTVSDPAGWVICLRCARLQGDAGGHSIVRWREIEAELFDYKDEAATLRELADDLRKKLSEAEEELRKWRHDGEVMLRGGD